MALFSKRQPQVVAYEPQKYTNLLASNPQSVYQPMQYSNQLMKPSQPQSQPPINYSPVRQTSATTFLPAGSIGSKPGGGYIMANKSNIQAPPPVQTPPPAIKEQVQQTPTDTYLSKVQNRSQERITQQEKSLADYLQAIKEQNVIRQQNSEAQKAEQEANYQRFAERARAGAENVAAASQGLKDVTVENYGKSLRRGAEAGREQEAMLTARFAGANTLDSSAFQNAMINSKAGLVGGQQSILNEQARSLNQIDADVAKAKTDAENLITDEGAKLQTALREISSTYAVGSIEYDQAVRQAYQLAQENINTIKDSYDAMAYKAEQEKLAAGNTDNLSQKFLTTGVPETMNDLIFRQKNPDKAKSIYEQATAQGGTGGNANQNKALRMVDSLLSQDTNPITGTIGSGFVVPGSGGSVTKTDWEGLKSLLTLAERGQLKGSGAVSDFETKMLEKAAAAGLNERLPDEVFRQRLQQLKQDLMSGGASYAPGEQLSNDQLQQIISNL